MPDRLTIDVLGKLHGTAEGSFAIIVLGIIVLAIITLSTVFLVPRLRSTFWVEPDVAQELPARKRRISTKISSYERRRANRANK